MPRERVPRRPVIEARGLRKTYGTVDAVADVELEVYAGEVFALLGPNGAGNTTTVEILEGAGPAPPGTFMSWASTRRKRGREWRARIGVVLQEAGPEAELTAAECLSMYAGYYARPRPVAETLELVGLSEQRATRCGQMSGDQGRRLDVALALVGDPDLIFLDEPTTGFDPAARQSAWAVIAGLRDLGMTIFLTTHYMEEAEELADRIAALAAGRIVAEGTPATLGGRDTQASVVSFTLPPGVPVTDLPPAVAARVTRTAGGHLQAETASPGPVVTFIHNVDAAQPIVLAIDLPLTFICGIFIPPPPCPAGWPTSAASSPSTPSPTPCWPYTTRTRLAPGCAGPTWPSSLPGAQRC